MEENKERMKEKQENEKKKKWKRKEKKIKERREKMIVNTSSERWQIEIYNINNNFMLYDVTLFVSQCCREILLG